MPPTDPVPSWIKYRKDKKQNLQDPLIAAVAGSSLPLGFALVFGGFSPDFLLSSADFGFWLSLAGLALIHIPYLLFTTRWLVAVKNP